MNYLLFRFENVSYIINKFSDYIGTCRFLNNGKPFCRLSPNIRQEYLYKYSEDWICTNDVETIFRDHATRPEINNKPVGLF